LGKERKADFVAEQLAKKQKQDDVAIKSVLAASATDDNTPVIHHRVGEPTAQDDLDTQEVNNEILPQPLPSPSSVEKHVPRQRTAEHFDIVSEEEG